VYTGNENVATYTNIPPGEYVLKINATNTGGVWSRHVKTLQVIILPPFWQTWWFISLCVLIATGLIYLLVRNRIAEIRKKEQQKFHFERQAMELEAQALRAQMNPHFIFNCLNSIKALIQEDDKVQAVNYLTTFSKLIRNQLQNAQKEISLHDELETCKLYVKLESLRFGSKVSYDFEVDENVDTHSLSVPPLIIQPFIENAIWHGILPKDEGGKVKVAVTQKDHTVQCIIEDNGIGRQTSLNNKSITTPTHQSKGMKLIQSRLDLHAAIHNRGGVMEVIDKKDEHNGSTGTLVIISFKTA
jgi:sensor histidine kinase YesM